jgi:hypothetical protein
MSLPNAMDLTPKARRWWRVSHTTPAPNTEALIPIASHVVLNRCIGLHPWQGQPGTEPAGNKHAGKVPVTTHAGGGQLHCHESHHSIWGVHADSAWYHAILSLQEQEKRENRWAGKKILERERRLAPPPPPLQSAGLPGDLSGGKA